MMGVLVGAWQILAFVVPFIVLISAIVFVHELGHFLAGRWCGMDVDAFSVGFGREVVGRTDRRGTRWRLSWMPIGGYVRFTPPDTAKGASFYTAPVAQRALVVAAGPVANLILAFLVYAALSLTLGERTDEPRAGIVRAGRPAAAAGIEVGDLIRSIGGHEVRKFADIDRLLLSYESGAVRIEAERGGSRVSLEVVPEVRNVIGDAGARTRVVDIGLDRWVPPVIGEVTPGSPAEQGGLAAGDRIVAIDGRTVASFDDLVQAVIPSAGRPLSFRVLRGGRERLLAITPEHWQTRNEAGEPFTRGRVGVRPLPGERHHLSVPAAATAAARHLGEDIATTAWGLGQLLTGRHSVDQAAGPIVIAAATAEVAHLGIEPFLRWMAMLSVNLGLLNLLPIPVLDGGHLVTYAVEAARRRPLTPQAQVIGYRIGLATLLIAMAVINVGDLLRLGRWLMAG